METNFTKHHQKLLNVAVDILIRKGIEELTILSLSEKMCIDSSIIIKLFETDTKLCMNTMWFAATQWIQMIEHESDKLEDENSKIRLITEKFAFGTVEYPGSLSSYIDVWKRIRMMPSNDIQEDIYIKQSLLEIYQLYVDFFCRYIYSVSRDKESPSNEQVIAWLMVVISDGIHIQSLLNHSFIDKNKAVDILIKMIKQS